MYKRTHNFFREHMGIYRQIIRIRVMFLDIRSMCKYQIHSYIPTTKAYNTVRYRFLLTMTHEVSTFVHTYAVLTYRYEWVFPTPNTG